MLHVQRILAGKTQYTTRTLLMHQANNPEQVVSTFDMSAVPFRPKLISVYYSATPIAPVKFPQKAPLRRTRMVKQIPQWKRNISSYKRETHVAKRPSTRLSSPAPKTPTSILAFPIPASIDSCHTHYPILPRY